MAIKKKKVLRHERVYYLNVAKAAGPVKYELFGGSMNSLTTDLGATVEDDHYITDKNGSSTRTATAKVQTFSGDMIVGDAALDYILSLAYALGTEAETTMVEVDTFNPDESGKYPAREVTVMINLTNDGSGDAGAALQVEGEIRWQGDPVTGKFDKSTKSFTADGAD